MTSTTQDIFPRFSSWTQRTPKALKSPFIFPSRFEALTSVEDDDNRVITEWSHAKTALDAQLTVIGAAAVSLLG